MTRVQGQGRKFSWKEKHGYLSESLHGLALVCRGGQGCDRIWINPLENHLGVVEGGDRDMGEGDTGPPCQVMRAQARGCIQGALPFDQQASLWGSRQ